MPRERLFALCDANSFYASAEAVFEPRLWATPLVVLSNNDGTVVALNAPAKALGIQKFEPFFRIRHLVAEAGLAVRSSNFELYGDVSRRMFDCLRQFSDRVEEYSIDEAFVELLLPLRGPVPERLALMRRTVKQWTGIPLSIGAGRTKVLAKAAAWVAKKQPEVEGVFHLADQQAEERVLSLLPVGEVWGIGRRWRQMLEAEGVETALHLRDLPQLWVRKRMGVVGLRTVLELRGMSCLPLQLAPPARKSMVVSRSFGRPVASQAELAEAVASFTAKAAVKLRREHLAAGALTVFAQSSAYREGEFYSRSVTATIATATNHTPTLLRYAQTLVERVWKEGVNFAKAGVMLGGITDEGCIQLSLFDEYDPLDERPGQLMRTVDGLNRQHGLGSVRFAAEGTARRWRTRAAFRSNRWTTRWAELPQVL
jgi:DNA polymerase V